MWKCLVACTGETPTEGTYWTQVSIISELIALRQAISQGGGGMKELDYAKEYVIRDSYTTTKDGVLLTGNVENGNQAYVDINNKSFSFGSGLMLPIKTGTRLRYLSGYISFIPYKD